uniref:Fibrinogen C-terminal domain-containing protein n=1 Tax=Amphimedon queenslandica TaxID=400682 RepID=A0A1X7TVY3_AMPQE
SAPDTSSKASQIESLLLKQFLENILTGKISTGASQIAQSAVLLAEVLYSRVVADSHGRSSPFIEFGSRHVWLNEIKPFEIKMNNQYHKTQDSDGYLSIDAGKQENENVYELPEISNKGHQQPLPPPPKNIKNAKQRQSSWSKPLLFDTVLLCLILILLIIILGIVTVVYATGNNVECINPATDASSNECEFTRDSAQKLINIVNTLSNLQDTSTSTAGVVDDILLIAQELLVLHNESTALPTSCKQLHEQQPSSPSGYYILAGPTGTYSTYCNMGTLCGSGGGWTRLAYLDMTDATQNCPSGLRLYQPGGVRACGRTNSSGVCASVQFPSNGISYSQICGRVTGYQFYTTDAFQRSSNLNSYYVDGVSITRGSPRQHVWTLANGFMDTYNISPHSMCPCSTGSSQTVPSFVGNHYFCESGNHASNWANILYTSDPLWDGQGCGSLESPCCNVPGIPWFHRDYGNTTTADYIELRVCGNEGTSNEDSPVGFYEIYVK